MRLALVATPATLPDLRPTPGSLDGDMLRARLPLPDTSFRVVDLDPGIDLAEQMEDLFASREADEAPILFYASCPVILSVEGELFLRLDPGAPDTGDSLRDIALVFREHARGPVAFVVECRHTRDPDDPFLSISVVSAAKEAVKAADGAVELLVAATAVDSADAEDHPSALTRALIEALDDPEAQYGLTLAQFFAAVRERAEVTGALRCFAHVRAEPPFEILPEAPRPPARHSSQPILPPSSAPEPELEPEVEPEPEIADPLPGRATIAGIAPPDLLPDPTPVKILSPREPFRSEAASIPVLFDEEEAKTPTRSELVSVPVLVEDGESPREEARGGNRLARATFQSVEISIDLSDEGGRADVPATPLPASSPVPPAKIPSEPPKRESFPPVARPASEPPKRESFPPVARPASEPPKPRSSEPPKRESFPPVARPASEPPKRESFPPVARPASEPPKPRGSEPVAGPTSEPPQVESPVPAQRPSSESSKRTSAPPKTIVAADHVTLGDALRGAGDLEAALASYKRALGMLGSASSTDRAEIYVRLGQLKQSQDKRREAIANYEKALALFPAIDVGAPDLPPAQQAALSALVDLNVAEGDLRGVAAAEDGLLATLFDPDERFSHLVAFGRRWQDQAGDLGRARATFERARALKPDDLAVLDRLAGLYRLAGMPAEALMTGQKLAALTRDPRERAERYFTLGKQCLDELRKDELGLELFDLALESDPTMLEPLALMARVLGERQEWSQLEQAYRRMLERVDDIPEGPIRTEVTFELCRRLGLLFRNHLEDPALGLDAFEDAVHTKPSDLDTRLVTAELARSLGKHDRAAVHLAEAAFLEPTRADTYHDLFEAFQKLRRPDQAFQAAGVTMLLRKADARERFIFEEHKSDGVPKPTYALPAEGWEWLRPHDRDVHAEAVLAAITPAAIAVRLGQLAEGGRLPTMDPALRQDPERSTLLIVRSFTWASHFLGVAAPAIYLNDDPQLSLAAVVTEEPTVIAGVKAQRGRSLSELAFLVGRHLAYHVGPHRLLLYYPSIEELAVCFLSAVRIVMPEVPAPPTIRSAVNELGRGIALRLTEAQRVDLAASVAAFEAAGSRSHLAEWAGDVERCATRSGFLLAGDLEVAAALLRAEPRAVLSPEEKVADLCAFAVSEEHHALRESLGIAIQP